MGKDGFGVSFDASWLSSNVYVINKTNSTNVNKHCKLYVQQRRRPRTFLIQVNTCWIVNGSSLEGNPRPANDIAREIILSQTLTSS